MAPGAWAGAESSPGAPGAWWSACAAIADDGARLVCYDEGARQVSAPVGPVAAAAAAPVHPAASVPAAAARVAAELPPDAAPDRFRVTFSFGYGVGDYVGRFKVFDSGTVRSDSGLGSGGDAYIAEAWLDRWPARDWSVALAYLRFRNRGRINIVLPKGVFVLTDPVQATTEVDARAQLGMIEAAYRPDRFGPLRPYVGAGLGGGYGHVFGSATLQNDFIHGCCAGSGKVGSPVPAVEAFMGVDVPVYRQVYLALGPRVIWATGHPFGLDERYLDFILAGGVGVQF